MTWPIGRGRDFLGTYDIATGGIRLLEGERRQDRRGRTDRHRRSRQRAMPISNAMAQDEIELVREACKPFDLEAFREGHLTPVFFGSRCAISASAICSMGSAVRAAAARAGVEPAQGRGRRAANDRLRVQDPGQHGSQPPRPHRLRAAVFRQAYARHEGEAGAHRQDRCRCPRRNSSLPRIARIADEAFAGDVVGIPNHGTLRIGDTLTEGEEIDFIGVPSFAPEILRRVRLTDAMKAKKLKEALQQMSEEGVVQVFRPRDGSPAMVGVVGQLQLDVLKARLDAEYAAGGFRDQRISARALDFVGRPEEARRVHAANGSGIADDVDGDPVFLARNQFYLDYTRERAEGIVFTNIKDVKKSA